MDILLSPEIIPNVASFLAIGLWALYLLRQVITWLKEDKSDLKQWESASITHATEAGKFTMERFNLAREQLKDLELDLREQKLKEAEIISAHRNEITALKEAHAAEIKTLQIKINELQHKLEGLNEST